MFNDLTYRYHRYRWVHDSNLCILLYLTIVAAQGGTRTTRIDCLLQFIVLRGFIISVDLPHQIYWSCRLFSHFYC
jgi:hypothetical protein